MISVIFLTILFTMAFSLGLGSAFTAIRLSTSLRFGIFLVLALFCVETWFVQLPAFSLGLNVYPQDLLFLGLAVIGAGRVMFGTNKCAPQTGWLLFGFMLFVSLVIGYSQYKTKAGVDLRPTFYFWATAFFISTFRISFDEATRILRMYSWVGVLVLLIVAYRWVSDALGVGAIRYDQIGAGKPLRVLTAGQTYFLSAMTLFLAYMFATRDKLQARRWPWMVVPFGLVVLLLQHRSVWIATLVGLGVIYVGAPQLRARFRQYALIAFVAGSVLLVPFLVAGVLNPVVDALSESVQEALQTRNSTLTWRLQSTRELFMQWLNGGPKVHLIGKPFGSGYERYLEDLGHVTDYSPHNLYIQMLLRVGLIGIFGLMVAYIMTALNMWKRRFEDVGDNPVSATPWAAVLVSSLVFFYPYGAHFVQGLFLGLAIALYRGQALKAPTASRSLVKPKRIFLMYEMTSGARLAVILACHNRKLKTLACIEAVLQQVAALRNRIGSCDIVLVDDGSTDGTAEAVRERFSQVRIIAADGSLFWCRAMHLAQTHAFRPGVDFLLWLNDDLDLASDALVKLIDTHDRLTSETGYPVAIVGSLRDPETGRTTYGGLYRAHWWQRTKLKLVEPKSTPVRVVSMNGNCVLLPAEIVRKVGNFDARFEHAMGDMDYGLRVVEAGFGLWVAAGYVGTCSRNSIAGTYLDRSISFRRRWRHILSAKGLPPRSWHYFTRRHAGAIWPLYWGWPYVRLVLSSTLSTFRRNRG